MLKTMVKVERKANELMKKAMEKVNNQDGFTTVEWVLLVIVVACIVVLTKPLWSATFTKFAGLFDTTVVDKFNAVK